MVPFPIQTNHDQGLDLVIIGMILFFCQASVIRYYMHMALKNVLQFCMSYMKIGLQFPVLDLIFSQTVQVH